MTSDSKRQKKAYMDPLDREQVNFALEQINELHPLNKTPLYVVFPGLRPFRSVLNFVPGMNYVELSEDGEHEMNDLIA